MKLVDGDTGETAHVSWDAAQALLASGGSTQHADDRPTGADRGPDIIASQSPAPGTDPKTPGLQVQLGGSNLPNMSPIGTMLGGIMSTMDPNAPRQSEDDMADARDEADRAATAAAEAQAKTDAAQREERLKVEEANAAKIALAVKKKQAAQAKAGGTP